MFLVPHVGILLVSIPQAVGTIAMSLILSTTSLSILVSIPQAVGTIAMLSRATMVQQFS